MFNRDSKNSLAEIDFLLIVCKNVQKKQTFSLLPLLSAGWVASWVAGATRFLIQQKSKIIPVEIKSGKTGHLKSLNLFMNQGSTPVALRIHSGNLYIQDIERADGSTYKLLSLPFYMVHRLQEIVDKLI